MEKESIEDRWKRIEGDGEEYLEFDRVANPASKRPDLCAFLLLDRLIPSATDIVSHAEHDEIGLDVDVEALNDVASDEDIITLIRCGVMLEDGQWLKMFT